MRKRIGKNMAGLLFLVVIFGFMLYDFWLPDIGFSENENRILASAPDLTVESVLSGEYGTDYETWLTDQFPFRNQWIAVKTVAERLTGRRESNGIYFGEDGYLLEAVTEEEIDRERAEGNIAAIQSYANAMEEKLGKGHSKVMLVPTSALVLSNKLPAFAPCYDQEGMLKQMEAGLNEGIYVDVEATLNAHDTEYIYYRSDHHWTTLGAYYAYEALTGNSYEPKLVAVTDRFSGTYQSRVGVRGRYDTISIYEPETEISYEVNYNLGEKQTDTFYERSYLEKKDKYGMFFDGNQPLVQITNTGDREGKLLIVKDSFANCFAPFVAEDYKEVHMIDLRYFHMPISQYIDQYGITDVLVLYNMESILDDRYISNMGR